MTEACKYISFIKAASNRRHIRFPSHLRTIAEKQKSKRIRSMQDSGNSEMKSKYEIESVNDNGKALRDSNEISENIKFAPDTAVNPNTSTDSNARNGQIPQNRGILRNTNSDPIIVVTNHWQDDKKRRSTNSDGKIKSKIDSLWSSQEFVNPAFELDEQNLPSDCKLSDLVQRTLRRGGEDVYTHPFGRGNLYTAVFLGEKSKVHNSGGMLAFWFAFIIMVVGLAGAIIFMAELYKRNEEAAETMNTTVIME